MPINRPILLTAAVFGAWAAPALAESSWVIAGDYGQKPARVVVMIDIGNVKIDEIRGEYGPGGQPYSPGPKKAAVNESVDAAEATLASVLGKTTGPFISVPMLVVYESANQPDFSKVTVRNFCDRKINDIYRPFTYFRNDSSSKDESAVALPERTALMDKLFNLTCGDTQATFAAGGFKPVVGEDAADSFPSDHPWKALWLDGKRPAYAKVSQATRDAREAEFQATVAKTKAILGSSEAVALGQIDQSNAESAFWKDQAQRRKHRPKSKLNPFLEGWLRKDEQYIVQNLGVPDGVYAAGNSRFLTYFNGWTQRFTTTNVMSGQVMGVEEQSYVCELTMELQDDQMIDFKFKGNSCGFGEFAGH
jgi:hypothetical protein